MKPELPSTPLPIGGVLDSAFRIYRSTFSQCWYLTLLFVVPTIVYSLVQVSVMQSLVLAAAGDPTQRLLATLNAFSSPAVFAAIIAVTVGNMLAYGSLIVTQKTLAEGKPISVGQALAAALRAIPAAIVAVILNALIIVLTLLLLIIPGIFFMGRLFLFQVAIYADRQGPLQAIGTSWELTNGRWWRGVTIYAVALVVYFVFNFAVQLVLTTVGGYVPVGVTLQLPLLTTITQLGIIASFPLLTAVSLTLYNDFKLRSQGGDLAARAAALRQA